MSIHTTRLMAEYGKLLAFANAHPTEVQVLNQSGSPPTTYRIRLHCKGMESLNGGRPVYRNIHELQLQLPANFPFAPPLVTVLTTVCNPHVFENGVVCLGSHEWNPAESLDVFLTRLRAILVWDPIVINPNSPANSKAMAWARANNAALPLDRSGFQPPQNQQPKIVWR